MSSRSKPARMCNPLPMRERESPVAKQREGEGTAPFRSLGVAAVAALLAADGPSSPGSPSGLLSRRAWEAELARVHGGMPDWYASGAERDRRFARWVQAEAKTLASRLDRLLDAGVKPALSCHVRAVAAALWADADWARRCLDGSLEE